ncbi:MAG: hypothetical protein P8L23_06330 [Flavobacteriales bacterium]|nr:hypothetical protein [Flavobacteriales bacterium]
MRSIALGLILLPLFIVSQNIGDSLHFELYSSTHYEGTIIKIEEDGYFIRIKNNREIYLSFFEIKSSVKKQKKAASKEKEIPKDVITPKLTVSVDDLAIGDEIDVKLKSGESHIGKLNEVATEKLVVKTNDSIFKIFFISQIQEISVVKKQEVNTISKEKSDTTKKLSAVEICNCGKIDALRHGKGFPFLLAGSSLVLSWFPVFTLRDNITPTMKYGPEFKDVTASKNSYLHKNEVYLRCYRNEVIKRWRITKYTGLGITLFLMIATI